MFDYAAARRYLQKKQEARTLKNHQRWHQAKKDVDQIIALLITKYHPKRIIQWGSVLKPEQFCEISDIDLAVVGIDAITFLKLYADAENLTSFPLDLIRWEDIYPEFQAVILNRGQVIYEAG